MMLSTVPLSPEYEESDQYLASVDVSKFSLELEAESASVPRLRDTVNLLLLLQSELHRRFCLSFCSDLRPELTGVTGLWRLCQDLTLTLDNITEHLTTVLKYHQCLGVDHSQSPPTRLEMPGRQLTPQLTSGSLHLQNCLLKLRQVIDSSDCELLNTRDSLTDIISELKTSQDILTDALETVNVTINPEHIQKIQSKEIQEEEQDEDRGKIIVIKEDDEIRHEDEVFEAFIKKDISTDEGNEDEKRIDEGKNKNDKKQSRRVLTELKTVLVEKQKEWRVREGKAIARQKGVEYVEDKVEYSLSESDLRTFRQAHLSDDESSSMENISEAVGHQLLSSNKLFRRPGRAATTKNRKKKADSSERSENVIFDREGIPRTLNIQPSGFDSQ